MQQDNTKNKRPELSTPDGSAPTQSMGRVGSCFDNAAAEAFFSSLEWEVLRDAEFRDLEHAQAEVQSWCYGFYNHTRRHSHNLQLSPVNFEELAA